MNQKTNSRRKQAQSKNGKAAVKPFATRSRAVTQTRSGSDGDRKGEVKSDRGPASAPSHRQQLEEERREVNAELVRLRAELQQAPEPTGDEVDLSVYDREKTLSLLARYERRLNEIEHALRATQSGAYGICERCHKPIDPARLEIFPEATLCVKCKNEKEQLAKRGLL